MSHPLHARPDSSRRLALAGVAVSIVLCWGWGLDLAPGQGSGKAPPQIVPVDESSGNPAFHSFWGKFKEAVKARDGAFILSVVSDRVKLSFGESTGKADFAENWRPGDPKSSLWRELDEIIRLGGALGGDAGTVFSAPYAFRKWPEQFDVFEHVFVTGSGVRFRAAPEASAQILRTVSWEIMKMEHGDDDWRVGDWARLRAYNGQMGYVHLDLVRSPIDFRIGFSEDGQGSYQLDYLVAGD